MTIEPTADDRLDEARAFLARAEAAFRASDIDAIISLFAEDVQVTFADFPLIVGRDAYRRFLEDRLKRQLHYRPVTNVRIAVGRMIGASWEATWTDAVTGIDMQGRGCEFITLENGLVADFVVCFNAWEQGGDPRTPLLFSQAE